MLRLTLHCPPTAQYENLTAPGMEPLVLADLKRFLGLDPALPEVGLCHRAPYLYCKEEQMPVESTALDWAHCPVTGPEAGPYSVGRAR